MTTYHADKQTSTPFLWNQHSVHSGQVEVPNINGIRQYGRRRVEQHSAGLHLLIASLAYGMQEFDVGM